MTDQDDIWGAIKEHKKEKFDADRARFLSEAKATDDGQWVKHTEHHWSRSLSGERLDYWPSRKKFMYQGRVMRGNVHKFIDKTQRAQAQKDQA